MIYPKASAAAPSCKGFAIEWRVSRELVPYADAVAFMEARVAAIAAGEAPELIWLLEHPPLYTAGASARAADLVEARLPVHESGRGGQFTYHGPGQRVIYVMLNLNRRKPNLRAYVSALEAWLIAALSQFGIAGERREGRIGVWVSRPDKPRGLCGEAAEDKIAAIGVRVRRWVSFHGAALNVAPDLSHFSGIVPCGISAAHLGVTSLGDLGVEAPMIESIERSAKPLGRFLARPEPVDGRRFSAAKQQGGPESGLDESLAHRASSYGSKKPAGICAASFLAAISPSVTASAAGPEAVVSKNCEPSGLSTIARMESMPPSVRA